MTLILHTTKNCMGFIEFLIVISWFAHDLLVITLPMKYVSHNNDYWKLIMMSVENYTMTYAQRFIERRI